MIIPYGHENTTVRRLPWVTFCLMGLCVVVFVMMSFSQNGGGARATEDLSEFFQYLTLHPYLDIDPEVESFILRHVPEEEFRAFLEFSRESGARKPTSPRRLAAEQAKLDDISSKVLASLDEAKQSPFFRFGLVPADFEPHALITYQFLHGGWLHLFGNLFFLFLAGPFIEDMWGRPLFAGFYLVAGAFSAVMFAARYPALDVPLIGASGAVAGVMGAFLVRFWKTKIRFFYWFGFIFTGTFMAPAWLMLPLWFLRELLFAQAMDVMAPASGGGGVAHWAHVWGFGFGCLVAVAMAHWKIEERFIHNSIESKITVVDNTSIERAMETAAAGKTDQAVRMLSSELEKQPDSVDAAVALWNLSLEHGSPREAAPHMMQIFQTAARSGDPDLILAHWQDVMNILPDLELEPALGVRLAEILAGADRPEGAAQSLEFAERSIGPATPVGVAFRWVRLASSLGVSAAAVAEDLLRHPDLPTDAREELESIRSESSEAIQPDPTEEVETAPPMEVPLAGDHTLQVMEAIPQALDEETLTIQVGGETRRLALDRVEAVAVGGVRMEGGRQVLVLDLMLDAPWSDRHSLRVVRLLSTAFDPRTLASGENPTAAFQSLLDEMIGKSGAAPLPDPESARGRPFRSFNSLDDYQREVMGVA